VSTCCARPPLSSVAPLFQTNPLNLWLEVDASVAEKILEREDVLRIINLMGVQSSSGVQELGCSTFLGLTLKAENQAVIGSMHWKRRTKWRWGRRGASCGGEGDGGARVERRSAAGWVLYVDQPCGEEVGEPVGDCGEGGIEAVERAIRAHQSIVEVQEAGCGALRDFVLWGSGLGSHFREADAVAPVQK
jgi:hypothetical protein